MRRKLGDKVKIKSLEWYQKNCDYWGVVDVPHNFVSDMAIYCGKETDVVEVLNDVEDDYYYRLLCDNGYFFWSDEMFDDITEIRREKILKLKKVGNDK